MRVSTAISNMYPQNSVEQVFPNKFSCRVCADIEKTKDGNSYSFTSYRDTFYAASYAELLVNIIHTRYTYDDENNFINDYLAEGMSDKYKAYRDFVTWAKAQAKEYFKGE